MGMATKQRKISWPNCSAIDLPYEIYVRKKIALGIKAADEGRVVSHEEVKKRFIK